MLTISGIRGKFSGVKASRDVGLSVIAGASRRVSGVRNSMRLPGHDVIRSIPNAIVVAGSRQLHSRGLGMAKRDVRQLKSKIRKTNLECPLQSTKPKNGVGKEAVKPAFPSSPRGVKPFTANMLRANRRLHRGWSASIILQLLDLDSQLRRIRGQFSVETKPPIPRNP